MLVLNSFRPLHYEGWCLERAVWIGGMAQALTNQNLRCPSCHFWSAVNNITLKEREREWRVGRCRRDKCYPLSPRLISTRSDDIVLAVSSEKSEKDFIPTDVANGKPRHSHRPMRMLSDPTPSNPRVGFLGRGVPDACIRSCKRDD